MNKEFKNVVLADDELEKFAGGADNGYPRKDNRPGPFVYEDDNGQPRYRFFPMF